MSDVSQIQSASKWVPAAGGLPSVSDGVARGLFIKAGGNITVTDLNGDALTITATADTVYPIRVMPGRAVSAVSAWLLW